MIYLHTITCEVGMSGQKAGATSFPGRILHVGSDNIFSTPTLIDHMLQLFAVAGQAKAKEEDATTA